MGNKSSIENPSIDISVNFLPNQREICYDCYKEICKIYDSLYESEGGKYNIFYTDGVVYYCDGWYFNIYISLKETELIKKIIEKIAEYRPTE